MTGEISLLDSVVRRGKGYTIALDANARAFIFCISCRKRSYDVADVQMPYCPFCHHKHDDDDVRTA